MNKLLHSDGTFNYSALELPIPEKSAFVNRLSGDNGKEPTDHEYNQLLSVMKMLHCSTFADLIFVYGNLDALLLICSLACINRFYYKITGLSVLRFNSLSSFGYQYCLKGATERVPGVKGIAFLKNESERLFLANSTSGGLQHCETLAGRLEQFNSIDLPEYDPSLEQTKILCLDENSQYPFVFCNSKLPQDSYQLHHFDDKLVIEMNETLSRMGSEGFIDHFKQLANETSTYFLISVDVFFPVECHDELDVAPCVRKRKIDINELSSVQRMLMTKLSISVNSLDQAVVVSDLLPQTVTVSLSYLSVLVQIGVKIKRINECMTGFCAFFFRDAVQAVLELKRTAKCPFFRQLAKIFLNSLYGYTLLQNNLYENVAIATGMTQISKHLASPYLKRFKILSGHSVITYSHKRFATCDSLHFVGVSVQQESKAFFLAQYYLLIKKILIYAYSPYLFLNTKYIDTDCIFLYLKLPSYASCGIHLRTSDILYALREIIDFGPFLPFPENRLFAELKSRLTPMEYAEFLELAKYSAGREGLFKIDHDVGQYYSEPIFFYSLKSKSYILQCYAQSTPCPTTGSIVKKRVLKGPILKSRIANLELNDFLSMGQSHAKVLESKLVKINAKDWKFYLIELSRYRPNCFCKKRFLCNLIDGSSRPFGHFRNSLT